MEANPTIQNLETLFGYTHEETAFLGLAALNSGYFLRRQFSSFAGVVRGKRATHLIEKLTRNGHIRQLTFRSDHAIYHLCARPFYAALGDENNRNRRKHQVLTIKNRIMGLDFILEHPSERFLGTENERLTFFADRLEMPTDVFPAKRYRAKKDIGQHTDRYFVDKFPISVRNEPLPSPVVRFAFVDEGLNGLSAFQTYLRQYRGLFQRLESFEVVYVAAVEQHFRAAEALFARWFGDSDSTGAQKAASRLVDYFQQRERYERKDASTFTPSAVKQFRADRQQFSGAEYEQLFVDWRVRGDSAVYETFTHSSAPRCASSARFSTHLLHCDYNLFGSVAKGKWEVQLGA
jgi:hypothetical protein